MEDYQDVRDQIETQGKMLAEIRDALLGSLDGVTVGLIADHRDLKQRVTNQSTFLSANTADTHKNSAAIEELKVFRRDVKRAVALIAFCVPFAFEVTKGLFALGWEYIKGLLHK
jgi:hypothetical protein